MTTPDTDEEDLVLIRDVMRRHPVTVRPHQPAPAAAALLLDHQVVAVPVVTAEGELRGIVDESQLVRALPMTPGDDAVPVAVAELMTPAPSTAAPDDDLRVAVALLVDSRVPLVPVVDDGHLVGVVTARDLVGGLLQTSGVPGPSTEVAGRLALHDAVTRALTATPTPAG